MLFSVDQEGFFSWRLAWEYGRALGKSRRRTLPGKLLILPGAWIFMTGASFLVGMIVTLWEGSITADEAPGLVVMVPLILGLLLLGMSWTGFNRFPTALTRLLGLRQAAEQNRFYPNHGEHTGDFLNMDHAYGAVREVYEGKTAFFLRMDSGLFLILQKACFTSGDPDAFRRFMDERIGKPVIII